MSDAFTAGQPGSFAPRQGHDLDPCPRSPAPRSSVSALLGQESTGKPVPRASAQAEGDEADAGSARTAGLFVAAVRTYVTRSGCAAESSGEWFRNAEAMPEPACEFASIHAELRELGKLCDTLHERGADGLAPTLAAGTELAQAMSRREASVCGAAT